MPNRSPDGALADFLSGVRRAIQCVAVAEVRGTGFAGDRPQNVMVIPRGGSAGNIVSLGTNDGRRDLRFGKYLDYMIVHQPESNAESRFLVESLRYMYELLDLDGHEIVAYHWHPSGVSPVRFPHMYVPNARPLPVAGRGCQARRRQITINRAHFPTGPIPLADVISLLIRDFGIEPRRGDWEDVLAREQAGIG